MPLRSVRLIPNTAEGIKTIFTHPLLAEGLNTLFAMFDG